MALVTTFNFHIRRVDGYYTDPPLVIDDPFTVVVPDRDDRTATRPRPTPESLQALQSLSPRSRSTR